MDLINKTKNRINVLYAVALVTYKEWAAYRSHAMVSIFIGPVYFLVQIFIWKAVYSSAGSVHGLSLEQMVTYFGVSTLINYLIMDFADWNLQMLIHTGKFITFMLRPVSHVYFALSQKVGHRILGFLFEFLPVLLIFLCVLKIRILPANFYWFIISLALGFLMMFLINYSIGVMGFWTIKIGGIRRFLLILRSLTSGFIIPLVFFPQVVQKVLFFLPFQFIVYVPIRVFLGSYELAGYRMEIPEIVGIQALVVVIVLILTIIFSRIGIKRFTGVGI